MAKNTTESPIPRPVLNPLPPSPVRSSNKKRYVLQDQNDNVVATLINIALADQWIKERKKGAVKKVESNY